MGGHVGPRQARPNGVENPVWAHHILQTRQHHSYAANLSQCAHVTCYEAGDTWTVEAREVLGKEYIRVVCRKVNSPLPFFFIPPLLLYIVWKTYFEETLLNLFENYRERCRWYPRWKGSFLILQESRC